MEILANSARHLDTMVEHQNPGRPTQVSERMKHPVQGWARILQAEGQSKELFCLGLRVVPRRRMMPQDLHVPPARPQRVAGAPRQTADEVGVAEIFVSGKEYSTRI